MRNMKRRLSRAIIEEKIIKSLMLLSFFLVAGSLGFILIVVILRGLPALSLQMIFSTPKGGFYLGREGGIFNAIVGSLYLAIGGTVLALLFSLPLSLYLHAYARRGRAKRWAGFVRLALDVLWGIPSIVYGAFGFTLMLAIGLRASLLGGIITLALLEIPIMTRAIDEVLRMSPADLEQASFALGSTRLETAWKVVTRQMLPGMVTAILLAFGRAIGDAASVLFTAGYTDRMPTSLLRPVASLPLAVFFQLGTPFPEVQQRAYASALVLTVIVLAISLGSRWLARRLNKYTIQ
jgi:phosphate transport system permease protein